MRTLATARQRGAATALVLALVVTAACGTSRSRPTGSRPGAADRTASAAAASTTTTTAKPVVPASTAPHESKPASPVDTSGHAGPFPVTTMTIALVDSSRPTVSRGKTISPTRALTTVVRLPAIPGRWPLIVFAHGFKVGPDPYAQLCATWAAAGYVVAAPEFPLTDLAVAGPSLDENDLVNQPGDMRFVVTSLLAAGGAVAGQIQPGRLGVAGHSDGAETALATAADSALGAKAVIVMSGSPLGPSSSPGPMVNPPMLVIQGDHDTINAPNEGQAVYDSASPPRFLLHLLGADHLTPFAGPSPWQPIIRDTTLDFLDQYLTGNLPAGRELSDDARAGLATLESTP